MFILGYAFTFTQAPIMSDVDTKIFRLRLDVMGVVAIFWEACYIHPFDDVFLRRAPSRNWVVHSLHIAANCGRCGCGCDQTFLVVYRFGMQFVFFIFGDDVETCPEYEILNPA
jgi:hypothetical protein